MNDDDKIAAIKTVIYSNNPAHCGALDEVVGNLRWLDRTSAATVAGPMTPPVVNLIYAAYGAPAFPADTLPANDDEDTEAKAKAPAKKSSK